MTKKEIHNAVILGYREIIRARYHYQNLQENYEFPASFTEERVTRFRNYFLDYIYPLPKRREELNDAFQSLDAYIKNPEKLLRILLDSGSLLFKYGRHLPKILKAGLKALRSFRTATHFENQLVENAIKLSLEPPYSEADIHQLISALSRTKIDQFIEHSQSLFETLYDRKLVKKIIEIVNHLITKMKKRPQLYSEIEIRGLEIGRDIIINGDKLFDELSPSEQKQIFDLTIAIEREMLDKIYNS